MDALVLCGGRGTRLDAPVEKPLYEVAGAPMIDRVLAALRESRVDDVRAVTAPHAPDTREHVRDRGVDTIDADGEGYVADLTYALEVHGQRPVLSVVSDLPLLAPAHVYRALHAHDAGALTVCVPTALKEALDVSPGTTRAHGGRELAPAGLNVVDESDAETLHVTWDARLAVNVNYAGDAAVAEVLAGGA
jgi:adenosylcobinamide-phosphate guanylyltransferase